MPLRCCSKRLASRVKDPEAKPKKATADQLAWQAAGLHCSANERRADEASRDVEAWLKCKYMREHLGEEFGGVVTAATGFGIFVTLDAMYVEGLVHITELGGEYFRFDEARQELRGERTGIRYAIGTRVRVQVSRVDLDGRKIDFRLIHEGEALLEVTSRAMKDKTGGHASELPLQERSFPRGESSRGKPKRAAGAQGAAGKSSMRSDRSDSRVASVPFASPQPNPKAAGKKSAAKVAGAKTSLDEWGACQHDCAAWQICHGADRLDSQTTAAHLACKVCQVKNRLGQPAGSYRTGADLCAAVESAVWGFNGRSPLDAGCGVAANADHFCRKNAAQIRFANRHARGVCLCGVVVGAARLAFLQHAGATDRSFVGALAPRDSNAWWR